MSLKQEPEKRKRKSNFSRRGFLQGVGITSGVLTTGVLETEAEAQSSAKLAGPGEVPITLQINGRPYKATVEPRTTLLDTLRQPAGSDRRQARLRPGHLRRLHRDRGRQGDV